MFSPPSSISLYHKLQRVKSLGFGEIMNQSVTFSRPLESEWPLINRSMPRIGHCRVRQPGPVENPNKLEAFKSTLIHSLGPKRNLKVLHVQVVVAVIVVMQCI